MDSNIFIVDPCVSTNQFSCPTSPPTPFLDLPWDYEGKGLSFEKAALAINAYFDHEYPLQSRGLDLYEPTASIASTIITFMGPPRKDILHDKFWYSSHDGYDYGTDAGVNNGDPVYPAAPGTAEYRYDSAGGNTILIDHQNGYQTRYYHLQDNSYYPDQPGIKREVNRSTIIGRVGATGSHVDGSHIHIGVFYDKNYDKNSDKNFTDYEPDGATDPFGWEPYTDEKDKDPDPWEHYSFFYNGKQRTGSKSYYLWTKKLPDIKEAVTSTGGTYTVGDVSIKIEPNTFANSVTLDMQYVPSVKVSDLLWSIGPSVSITAKNILGDFITLLTKPIILWWAPFDNADLSRFKLGTIYIYSSKDRINWTKEQAIDPYVPGSISAVVNHLTYFAVMGERKDLIPPITTVDLQGIKGQENWFRSDVSLSLTATDGTNEDSAGIDYTLYKKDDDDWQDYNTPLNITQEGHHKVSFYSVDKDGNIEAVKTIEFDIDKTPPEISIWTEPSIIWPPNGKNVSVRINGTIDELHLASKSFTVNDEYGNPVPVISDFGDTIFLEARRIDDDLDGRKYIIKVMAWDLAGNTSSAETKIIVPHDKNKK